MDLGDSRRFSMDFGDSSSKCEHAAVVDNVMNDLLVMDTLCRNFINYVGSFLE